MFVYVVVIALLLASGCKEDVVQYDMARFDRSYIPALLMTGSHDSSGQSIMAVKRLKQDWILLEAKYPQLFSHGGEASAIGDIIGRSDMMITTGEYEKAHQELEKIRGSMYRTRKKYSIDYYLDYLTEFHFSMEKMLAIVNDKSIENITESDLVKMKAILPVLKAQWKSLEAAPFERTSFRFTQDSEKVLKREIAGQARNIEVLDAAFLSHNKKLIVMNAMKIKSAYVFIISMFGDFDSSSLR